MGKQPVVLGKEVEEQKAGVAEQQAGVVAEQQAGVVAEEQAGVVVEQQLEQHAVVAEYAVMAVEQQESLEGQLAVLRQEQEGVLGNHHHSEKSSVEHVEVCRLCVVQHV